jgi:hypothetical protein
MRIATNMSPRWGWQFFTAIFLIATAKHCTLNGGYRLAKTCNLWLKNRLFSDQFLPKK